VNRLGRRIILCIAALAMICSWPVNNVSGLTRIPDSRQTSHHLRKVAKRDSYITVSRAVLVDDFIGASEGCWPPPTTQAGSRQLANVRNVEA
jgi:hypothetical protein